MSKKVVLALLRHADYQQPVDVPSAHLPYPLHEAGKQQALDGAKALQQFAAEHGLALHEQIDSSKMQRAFQTAHIIGASLRSHMTGEHRIVEYDALAERSVGAVANLTTMEIERLMAEDPRYTSPPPGWKSDSHFQLPFQGAESLMMAGARVATHIEQRFQQLKKDATGDCLAIVVGHGASIRHAALHLGLLDQGTVGNVSMFHARPIFITSTPAGWSKLGGEWQPRTRSTDSDEIRNQ